MNIISSIRNRFLKMFGDIKVFRFPFFILYDPGSYKVKGYEVRKVIESIRSGDIMIRGYSNYLDGYFIPGFFSHAGLYLGKTCKSDFTETEQTKDKFFEGSQVVIHSMAEGVFMEDVLSFCKCDYLVILRRNNKVEQDLNLEDAFKSIYKKALGNLGKNYDFKFDFSEIGNLSCTELVFDCNSEFLNKYNVKLKQRWAYLKKREMLLPDDFVTDKFEIVFQSASLSESQLKKILTLNT